MDCLPCERCREVDWPEYRNKNCAILAGTLFTVGWWLALGEISQSQYSHFLTNIIIIIILFIPDASITDHENTKDLYHLCGVFSVISLVMVNSISNGHLQSDGLYTDGILSGVAAKIWFFVGFLFGFG